MVAAFRNLLLLLSIPFSSLDERKARKGITVGGQTAFRKTQSLSLTVAVVVDADDENRTARLST